MKKRIAKALHELARKNVTPGVTGYARALMMRVMYQEAKRLYLAVPKVDRKEWLRRECGIY